MADLQLALFRSRVRRILAMVLFVCGCLPAAARGEVPVAKSPYGHEFHPLIAIEREWKQFQEGAPPLTAIQSLLEKDVQGKYVVPLGETNFASVWVAVNRWLKQHPETLAALRIEQNSAAVRHLFVTRRSADPDRLMNIYRSYPWAAAVHQSLLETGEHTLRDGQPQQALRYFQDVLDRSENPTVRAQVGLWLAAAHLTESADAIGAMFRQVDSAARYPWFGQQLSAKEIEAMLTAGMKPTPPLPELNALSVRTIQLPDDSPWMLAQRLSRSPAARSISVRD